MNKSLLTRRAIKTLVVLICILCLLSIASILALQTKAAKNKLREQIQMLASDSINGTLQIGDLTGSIYDGFKAENIKVLETDGSVAVELPSIDLKYSLTGALDKKLDVAHAILNDPTVHIRIDEHGRTNLQKLIKETADDPAQFGLDVSSFAINRGRVLVNQGPGNLPPLELQNVTLESQVHMNKDSLNLSVRNFSAYVPHLDSTINAKATLQQKGDDNQITNLNASIGSSTLKSNSFFYSPVSPAQPIKSDLKMHIAKAGVLKWTRFDKLPSDIDVDAHITASSDVKKPWMITASLASTLPPLQVTGWANPTTSKGEINIKADALNPQTLDSSLPAGNLNLKLNVASSWSDDSIDLRADSQLKLSGTLMGVRISKGLIKANMSKTDATFDASLETDSGPVQSTGTVNFSNNDIVFKKSHVLADLNLSRVKQHVRGLGGIKGKLHVDASMSGPLDGLHSTGKAKLRGLRYANTRVEKGWAHWNLDFRPGASLGTVDLKLKNVVQDGVPISDASLTLSPRQKGSLVKGKLNAEPMGKMALKGYLDNNKGTWRFRLDDLKATSENVSWHGGNKGIIKRHPNGRITVEKISMQNGNGRLAMSTNWHPRDDLPQSLFVDAKSINIENALPRQFLPKRFALAQGIINASITSSSESPLTGSVDLKDFSWRNDVAPLNATIDASLNKNRTGQASISAKHDGFNSLESVVTFIGPKSWRSVRAWKRLDTKDIQSGSFKLNALRLETLSPLIESPTFSGLLNVDFQGGKGLRQSTLSVEASDLHGSYVAKANSLSGRMILESKGTEANLTTNLRSKSGGTVNILASAESKTSPFLFSLPDVKVDTFKNIKLDITKIPLTSWLPVKPLEEFGSPTWSGVIDYTPKADRLTMSTHVKSQDTTMFPGFNIDLNTNGNSQSITSQFSVETNQSKKIVYGQLELKNGLRALLDGNTDIRDVPASGKIKMDSYDIARTAKLFVGDDISGQVDANIELLGSIAKPAAKGVIELKRLRYKRQPLPKATITATPVNGYTDVNVKISQSKGTFESHVKGLGAQSVAFDIKAKNFGLRFLNGILLALEIPIAGLDGALNGNISGQQGLQYKDLVGQMTLNGGTIGFPRPIEPLHHVDLNLTFKDAHADLNIAARSGKGSLKGNINIALKNNLPVLAKGLIKTDSLPVSTKGLSAQLTSSVSVKANRKDDQWLLITKIIDGKIKLNSLPSSGKLHLSDPLSDVVYTDEHIDIKKENEKIFLKVKVATEGEPLQISGDKVNVYANVDVQANSSTQQVHLGGKTSIINGYVELFDRKYDVDQARIVFDEDELDDSSVDLKISRQFPEVEVIIAINGTIGLPEINMSTEPPIYSQAQIISLIINGIPGGKTGEDSADDAALSAIAGLVSQQLASAVKDPIGVDSLEFSTDEGGKISSVSVGKWISEKIFLAYYRHFETDPNENQDEAILEWWLKPTWLFELRGGDAGAASGDLLWIWRY